MVQSLVYLGAPGGRVLGRYANTAREVRNVPLRRRIRRRHCAPAIVLRPVNGGRADLPDHRADRVLGKRLFKRHKV